MRLRAWLIKNDMNQREAASYFDIDYTFICALLAGRRKAGLGVAVRLEKMAGIPAGSWMTHKEALETSLHRKQEVANRRRARQAAAQATMDEAAPAVLPS
jgi:plasmid maintenance system antidote protein VapI